MGETPLEKLTRQELQAGIKAMIGITTQVEVRDPGSIERSSGKARRVIDRRDAH